MHFMHNCHALFNASFVFWHELNIRIKRFYFSLTLQYVKLYKLHYIQICDALFSQTFDYVCKGLCFQINTVHKYHAASHGHFCLFTEITDRKTVTIKYNSIQCRCDACCKKCKLWSLKVPKYGFSIVRSVSHLTGVSAAVLRVLNWESVKARCHELKGFSKTIWWHVKT